MARLTKAKSFRETLAPHLVELLLQAKDQILAAPYAFQMYSCAKTVPVGCGTALCLLGHMAIIDSPALLNQERVNQQIVNWRMARPALLTSEWDNLFLPVYWPNRFDPRSVESAAARIDHWLETGQ